MWREVIYGGFFRFEVDLSMNGALSLIGWYVFVGFLCDYLIYFHLTKGFSIDTF